MVDWRRNPFYTGSGAEYSSLAEPSAPVQRRLTASPGKTEPISDGRAADVAYRVAIGVHPVAVPA